LLSLNFPFQIKIDDTAFYHHWSQNKKYPLQRNN